MPQPFKHKPGDSLQQGGLEARPKCAIQIACIAAEWTEVEERLASSFWTLTARVRRVRIPSGAGRLFSSSPNPSATAIMETIESIRVRVSVVRAVLKVNAPSLEDDFEKLAAKIRKVAQSRNTVVHGSWRITARYPEDIVLIDGRSQIRYTEKDLRSIVVRITDLCRELLGFHFRCLEAVAKEPPEVPS